MPLIGLSGSHRRRPGGLILNTSNPRRHRPDYVLLLLSVLLVGIGLIVVYSISPGLSAVTHTSEQYYVSKQAIAVLVGLVAFAVFGNLPVSVLRRFRLSLLAVAAISALLVQVFGEEVNGAYRWIQIGGFSFQSVELIKFALIVYVADLLASAVHRGELASWTKTLKPLLGAILISGAVVAGLQSDLGSAGVIIAVLAMMAFSAGVPLKKIALIGAIIIGGLFLAVSSSSYRRDRLSTYLNPEQDCQSSGYQACQALIAIGSGGLFGLGLGKSVQAYGYLPEAANDSIFAISAEKFGFVGVSLLLALYLAVFNRIKKIIIQTTDAFSRFVALGILIWLSTQVIINVGSMIGLLPLKGITLPLISYGGTSIVFVMAAMGVVFQLSRFTSLASKETGSKERPRYENSTFGRRDRRPYYAALSRRP